MGVKHHKYPKHFKDKPIQMRFILKMFYPCCSRVLFEWSEEIKCWTFIAPASQDALPLPTLQNPSDSPPPTGLPSTENNCSEFNCRETMEPRKPTSSNHMHWLWDAQFQPQHRAPSRLLPWGAVLWPIPGFCTLSTERPHQFQPQNRGPNRQPWAEVDRLLHA